MSWKAVIGSRCTHEMHSMLHSCTEALALSFDSKFHRISTDTNNMSSDSCDFAADSVSCDVIVLQMM